MELQYFQHRWFRALVNTAQRFVRFPEPPTEVLHRANIMNNSAPAKATHHAIETARNQVSRVVGPKTGAAR
jgi:hypothetical protein